MERDNLFGDETMNAHETLNGGTTGADVKTHHRRSRILIVVGTIAMLVGALDPLEGSPIVLLGSGLVGLGTFLDGGERRWIAYRTGVLILIAVGVGAMWGLSALGGFGGNSGRSMWWGVLVLPLFVGWSLGVWGPGQPRWPLVLGIAVSLWYLAIPMIVLVHGRPVKDLFAVPIVVISVTGLVTIGGCIWRLWNPPTERE